MKHQMFKGAIRNIRPLRLQEKQIFARDRTSGIMATVTSQRPPVSVVPLLLVYWLCDDVNAR